MALTKLPTALHAGLRLPSACTSPPAMPFSPNTLSMIMMMMPMMMLMLMSHKIIYTHTQRAESDPRIDMETISKTKCSNRSAAWPGRDTIHLICLRISVSVGYVHNSPTMQIFPNISRGEVRQQLAEDEAGKGSVHISYTIFRKALKLGKSSSYMLMLIVSVLYNFSLFIE